MWGLQHPEEEGSSVCYLHRQSADRKMPSMQCVPIPESPLLCENCKKKNLKACPPPSNQKGKLAIYLASVVRTLCPYIADCFLIVQVSTGSAGKRRRNRPHTAASGRYRDKFSTTR